MTGLSWRIVLAPISMLLGYLACLIPLPGLSPAGSVTLGIFVTAALLWVTEAVPLFVTSFVILFAEVVFLGLPGGPLGLVGTQWTMFLSPFFDPIVALFFGGFVLGIAMSRYQLDLRMAGTILARTGHSPRWILAGFMGSTAFLSMWLSNTATTVLMMAVLLPILRQMPRGDPFRKALVLGVPFAANVGGIGTPIGTPPNAIAIAALARTGIQVSFLEWMVLAVPVMLVVLAFAWWLLLAFFPPETTELAELRVAQAMAIGFGARTVMVVFAATLLLWLTAGVHGIPEGIVALVPVVVFFGLGLLEPEALGEVGWDVLFIVAGGISLGVAMQESGLTTWVVDRIGVGELGAVAATVVLAGIAALMTTFISNSATANLLLPIVTSLSGVSPVVAAAAVALAASMSMTLPISTPPNAIAYGTGEVGVADMARAGLVTTVVSLLVIVLLGTAYWSALGIG